MTRVVARLWGLSNPLLVIGLLLIVPSQSYAINATDKVSKMDDENGYFVLWSSVRDFNASSNSRSATLVFVTDKIIYDYDKDGLYDNRIVYTDSDADYDRLQSNKVWNEISIYSMPREMNIEMPDITKTILKTILVFMLTMTLY